MIRHFLRINFIVLILVAPHLALAGDVSGEQIATHGSPSGAPACVACHGPQLHGIAALKTPAIAGRPSAYILARLEHYAGPQGHNAQMKQVAAALTPAERQAVTAYLASLQP
jgi:cytochrome c553